MFLNCVGSVSWWISFASKPEQVLHLNHRFQKQSELSQYKIAGANGPILLSVPTEKPGRRDAYSLVKISYAENWMGDHWRGLEAAYRKSPFFEYYEFRLRPIYDARPEFLIDLNKALFKQLKLSLKLETEETWSEKDGPFYTSTEAKNYPVYPQVFDDRMGFVRECSIYDLLFNLGPESADFLSGNYSSDA